MLGLELTPGKPSLPLCSFHSSSCPFSPKTDGIHQNTMDLRFLLFPPALFSPSPCVSCVTHVCLCSEYFLSAPSCPFPLDSKGNSVWNSLISLLPRCLDIKHKGEVAGGAGREFAVHVAHPAVSSGETTKMINPPSSYIFLGVQCHLVLVSLGKMEFKALTELPVVFSSRKSNTRSP